MYIHVRFMVFLACIVLLCTTLSGLQSTQKVIQAQQSLSAGCSDLNDPYYDGYYGAGNNRNPPYTYFAGERILIKAEPPDLFDPTHIVLYENSSGSNEVGRTSYPGTLNYSIPASGAYSFGWTVSGNATFTVSCGVAMTNPTATATATGTATVTPTVTPTIENVELKIRAFIPCGAVDYNDVFDVFQDQMYGGDGRTFDYNNGTSRIDKTIVVTTDPSREPRISPPESWTVTTTQYHEDAGDVIPGLNKSWCKSLKPSAVPEVKSQTIPDIATVSRTNDGIRVHFRIDFGNPFAFGLYPNTNGDITVYLRQSAGSPLQYKLTGNHDGFPAYEVYLNTKLIYCHDPIASGDSPASLIGNSDITVDTGDWKDVSQIACEPIFGVRSNSPIGQKGSFFVITGNKFLPMSELEINVNNLILGAVVADSNGSFQVGFNTNNADPGIYTVNVSTKTATVTKDRPILMRGNQTASTSFEISQDAFLVTMEQGISTIVEIPEGIAMQRKIYLPLLAK